MANTFSDLWDEIKTAALNEVQSLKNTIIQWEGRLVPTIESDLVLVLSQFKSLAVNMVTTLAAAEFANLTGGQKQSITVNTIIQSALNAGKPIAIQDAQLLAQQAYNAVKSAVADVTK
jgi:hypothetical protein